MTRIERILALEDVYCDLQESYAYADSHDERENIATSMAGVLDELHDLGILKRCRVNVPVKAIRTEPTFAQRGRAPAAGRGAAARQAQICGARTFRPSLRSR